MHKSYLDITLSFQGLEELLLSKIILKTYHKRYYPEAPGISRAITDGAEVWDALQLDKNQEGPAGYHSNQSVNGDGFRSFLAVFPEKFGGRPVEFFPSHQMEQGEPGILSSGLIVWENGRYSTVEFLDG